MATLEFTLIILLVAVVAGLLGALTGLGGGMVVVPFLTLVFGVDIRYAVGASLISVIATSSGAASAYTREGYTNIRLGMFLEIATTIGALTGASAAALLPSGAIAIVFGAALMASIYSSVHPESGAASMTPHGLAAWLRLNGRYPVKDGWTAYGVRSVPAGFGLMGVAGMLSGLLGIGSGALKVIAMDRVMGVPFKASTATSNFMIGVTAAASAGIYLHRGYIDPGLTMPVMLGVLIGSFAGARILPVARTRYLRWLFAAVLLALGVEMIYHGVTGKI